MPSQSQIESAGAHLHSEEHLDVIERLFQAMESKGYRSAESFANEVGVRPGTLRQQIARRKIPRDAAVLYAQQLNVSLTWLLTGKRQSVQDIPHDPPPRVQLRDRTSTAPGTKGTGREGRNVVVADPPYAVVGPPDLPVYGSAQGGGGMTVDPHPMEYVKRPAPLLSVAKGFAVYIVGDSMSPAYEQGDMVFVHPGLPVNRGDDALLASMPATGGDWSAIVKRVVGSTEKSWKLQQFNPRNEFSVPKTEYPQAFRIVGKYNRR